MWMRPSLMTLLYDEAAECFAIRTSQASLREKIPLWPGSTLCKQNTAFVQTECNFFFQLKFTPLTKQAVYAFHSHCQVGNRAKSPNSISNQLKRNNDLILPLKVSTLSPGVDMKSSTWL